jgi:xanthine dehydrogenase small subunit
MKLRDSVIFYLNGKRQEIGADHARLMLSDYLRYEKSLTGTKVVCAEGDCGACSVLKLSNDHHYVPINSCVVPVALLDGSSIVTVDALAKNDSELTPVQNAMVNCHGSQCGFCTPGFVVTITGAIEKKLCDKKTVNHLTAQEVKNSLTGNLCRCTGYQSIIDAATTVEIKKCESVADRFYSKTQDLELKKIRSTSLFVKNDSFSIFAPKTINEATRYLAKNKTAKLISGSTDLGVLSNKGKLKFEKLVSLHLIPALYELKKIKGNRVSVGARVNLTDLRDFLKPIIPQFSKFLDVFASPQIKNMATLIGNVGNASPIADTPPFLLVSNAIVHVANAKGKRKIRLDQFYLDYRKTALRANELITSIDFEIPHKTDSLALYKTSQRKDLDISIINAAFHVEWKKDKTAIKNIKISMGGVAAIPLRFKKTELLLKDASITENTLEKAIASLHSEITPLSDLRSSATYRRVVMENLFMKFIREHTA